MESKHHVICTSCNTEMKVKKKHKVITDNGKRKPKYLHGIKYECKFCGIEEMIYGDRDVQLTIK